MKNSFLFKQFLVAIVFICLLAATAEAQRGPIRWGKVDDEHMEMQRFEADTTAKAVILGDYGVVEMMYRGDQGFFYSYTRHFRVKVFDRDAFDLATFRIPLHSSAGNRERLSSFRGIIWTPQDGEMVKEKIRRSDGFMEEVHEYLETFNATMPNLQEGSVFEVEYIIHSPYLFDLPTWTFQGEYPILISEFRTILPDYFNYRPLMGGYLPLTEHDVENRNEVITTRYIMENAPAFISEPYMNSMINYVSKIEHELMSYTPPFGTHQNFSNTWPQVTTTLMESNSFGKQLDKPGFLLEQIETIMAENPEIQDRLIAAYQLIQKEMNWNGRNSIYARRSLRKAWDEKEGNAADINLMLLVLLRELGIQADPVIISTRRNGILNPAQIMLSKYNYVVVHATVGETSVILDATDKHTPYYLLPSRAINGKGRLISASHGRWVDLEAFNENQTITDSHIRILPCGSIVTKQQKEKTNYHRLSMENEYRSYDRIEDYMDEFEADNQGINLENFKLQNHGDWTQPLLSVYEFEIPQIDPTPKDLLYISPMLIDRMETNPFRLEQRQYPVDFVYPFREVYNITIEIPEGYDVEDFPRNARFSMPRRAGSYSAIYERTEDGNISVKVEFEIGKSIFTAEEYQSLRDFYTKIVEEQARNIVLKKT